MSKYTANYTAIYEANVDVDIELDPKDFLDCDTEDEVKETVQDYWLDIDFGSDLDVTDVYNEEFDIPEAFWDEWRQLKNDSITETI